MSKIQCLNSFRSRRLHAKFKFKNLAVTFVLNIIQYQEHLQEFSSITFINEKAKNVL